MPLASGHLGAAGDAALLGGNLLEAVSGALVDVLLRRLLGLHLQASSNGVEGVGGTCTDGDGRLRRGESADGSQDALVLLVGVQTGDGVEGTQLQATVADDAAHRHAEASVQGKEATGALRCLHDAVAQSAEGLLAGPHVRRQARPGIVQRVHNGHAGGGCQTTRHQVGAKELPKLGFWVVLWEHLLERVLEGQVEGLGREVADAVGQVAVPESLEALLLHDALGAVQHAGVAGHLPAADLRVGILRLHHELHALDRGSQRLRHCARHAAEHEVHHERLHAAVLPCHGGQGTRRRPIC